MEIRLTEAGGTSLRQTQRATFLADLLRRGVHMGRPGRGSFDSPEPAPALSASGATVFPCWRRPPGPASGGAHVRGGFIPVGQAELRQHADHVLTR